MLVFDIFYENLQSKSVGMKGVVNSKMIVLAREARGLNQLQLAEKIRMSATNLSKIERGEIGVSEELLTSIADVTSYPAQFFVQDGDVVPGHLGYRKRHHVAQRLLSPINAKVNIVRRHVQWLTDALQVEPPQLPMLFKEGKDAEQAAAKLRRLWNVEKGPVHYLVKLAEQYGIALLCFDFETDRVDSRSIFTESGYPLICLNKRLHGDRQRFTLAYEIGQLLMHPFSEVSAKRDVVYEASRFAAALLMPEKEIRKDFDNGISISLLADLKKKWKVSMIALVYRADDLGCLTPNQKRYLLQQFNQMNIRRREPVELDIKPEHPRLMQRWIAGYRSKTKLSTQEMAALLCVHVDEFLELYS